LLTVASGISNESAARVNALRASLLTRTSRRVDVTPAGERLYARCLSVYNAVLAAQKALENIEAERNITPIAHRETSAVDQ
jgi:DNA-binding transcriptional LysR family regulator